MYQFFKPLLFKLDPEKAHHLVVRILKKVFAIPSVKGTFLSSYDVKSKALERNVFGIQFKNPIGLAAGFDKDAMMIDELASFGFGFIEIGTVTPKPQEGNPKPRMFRLPLDSALINRMGFNNLGVEAAAARLKTRKTKVIIGGNIGKNKNTPNESAVNDYKICFETLYPYVDYFVVNVSSPNTPGLRELQEKEPLTRLLSELKVLNAKKPAPKPILLKIAPDLTDHQLDDIIEIVNAVKIEGVIATNTTISRKSLKTEKDQLEKIGAGGLSGKPLAQRSTEVIRYLKERSNNSFPVIGVGGIHAAKDAIEKIEAGADLIQIYTGFIYEGPSIVKNINKGLIEYYEKKSSTTAAIK